MVKGSGPVPSQKFLELACQILRAPDQTIFRMLPDSVPPVSNAVPTAGLDDGVDLINKSLIGLEINIKDSKIKTEKSKKFISGLNLYCIPQKTTEPIPKASNPERERVNNKIKKKKEKSKNCEIFLDLRYSLNGMNIKAHK